MIRRAGITVVATVGGAACAASAPAESMDPATRSPQPAGEVHISGEIDLARLVDLAAAGMGVPIQYADDLARRKVRVREPESISRDEVWGLASGLLYAQGFVTVELSGGRGLYVVASNQAVGLSRIRPAGEDTLASFSRVMIPADHASPEAVAEAVQPLLSPQIGSVAVAGDGVVVSDLTSRAAEIEAFVRGLDHPGRSVTSAIVQLRHVSVEEANERLGEIWEQSRPSGVVGGPGPRLIRIDRSGSALLAAPAEHLSSAQELLSLVDTASPGETRVYGVAGFELSSVAAMVREILASAEPEPGAPWRLVEDKLSMSMVVSGDADVHRQVQSALDRLAAIPAEGRRTTRVWTVRNRPVGEVAALLRELTAADGVGIAPAAGSVGASDVSAGGSGFAVTVDERSNTLLITADPALLSRIDRLFPTLDVRLPQVQVEVMLVSLSESQSRDLGVELQKLLDDAGTIVGLSSLFGLGSPALSATDPLIGGAGSSVVVLDPGDFSVVIRALESVNDGRALSMPKVLVNNNEDATIDSVLQQPFISTNAGDTISTTSFGGFEDAGTQVTVTPQIAAGDHLVLRYSINLSSFVGDSASPEAPPPRQQNSISSVATIPDGFTVVVGGIELQTEGYGEDRLPVLGRIPLVGNLFKSTSRSSSRQRFFAFIRATTLRDNGFEDLKFLSEVAIEDAGIDDGWPEVAPRIIR